MKIHTKILYSIAILGVVASGVVLKAHATITPTMYFSNINTSSYTLGVTADPNASITLYSSNISAGTTGASVTIGSTDQNGNFSTMLNSSSFGISPGSSVYVIVDGLQSNSAGWPSFGGSSSTSSGGLTLSQTSVTVNLGQNFTVTASTANGLYVSSNSNPSVAVTSLNGNGVIIVPLSYGSTNLTVCAANTNCETIYVTVGSSSTSNNGSGISFSQTNVTVNSGQSITVPIYGNGGYFISSNPNPSAVSATINGSSLYLVGESYGSSNISVCQNGGQCGTVYVSTATTGSGSSSGVASLASFSVSSNNATGAFVNPGDLLTISFETTQPVNNPSLSIAGSNIGVSGSGSGPYTAIYTVTNSQTSLPVTISFTDQTGAYHQTYLSLGNSPVTTTTIVPPSVSTVSTAAGCVAGNAFNTLTGGPCPGVVSATSYTSTPVAAPTPAYQFSSPLDIGSVGADVTALQERLTADGLYSGPVTGYYGSLTQGAVMEYQTKHGLESLGNVGPATRALLNQGI